MDEWRNWMDRGIAEFRAGNSRNAVDAFQRSADLNPASVDAHLLIAVSVAQQYIPGAKTAQNELRSELVKTALRRALELDQRNWVGCILLGHHLASESRTEEARTLFRRALEIKPDNADVRFALARIRFDEWVAGGKDAAGVSDIIKELEHIVSIDRLHDPAMEYIGVALRESGDAEASVAWMRAAADARSEKVQEAIANGTERSRVFSDSTGLLKQWAEATLRPFGPPHPPPPPDRRLASPLPTSASISFEPRPEIPEQKPRPIRVHHEHQARKLVRPVEPVIPGDPCVDNRLRFVVVVGAEGLISRSVMISGNCWLERFGTHALQQWFYEPTVVDGEPIEVVTEVWLTVHN